MDLLRKVKLIAAYTDTVADVIHSIEEYKYEPSERGAGYALGHETYSESDTLFADFITNNNIDASIMEELKKPVTIDDIMLCLREFSADDFNRKRWEELKEFVRVQDAESGFQVEDGYLVFTLILLMGKEDYIKVEAKYTDSYEPKFSSLIGVNRVVKHSYVKTEFLIKED